MIKQSNTSLVFCIYFILALATFAVFWQIRHHDFINYDDDKYVTENPHVNRGLRGESIVWAFTTPHGGTSYWHPLTWLSHMLDCELFGLDAGRHHLSNLLLHIINTLLLFWVLKNMTGAVFKSSFVAACFSLHPLHIESVAWVAERKDVLSTLFWILTMAAYSGYVKHRKLSYYSLALLVFAMGLMSKPMLVTLPCVLLLLDYWPFERFGKTKLHRLIVEKIPFFFLSAISSVVTFLVQRNVGAMADVDLVAPKIRIANAVVSYAKYIGKMFWPSNLAVFYPLKTNYFPLWEAIAAALLLLVISICVIWLISKRKYLLVGWLWYLGTLVPVIGIVQVGAQAMADRYSYMTLTGLFIIIAWGTADLSAEWRFRKVILGAAAITILSALSICTWLQLRYWRNSETVFEHALEVTNNNYVAHNNLGIELKSKGKLNEAMSHYRKAVKISPDYADVYNNIGVVFKLQGKFDDAVSFFHKTLDIEPTYAKAHNNLGIMMAIQGKFDDSISHFRQAIKQRPYYAEAYSNMGNALGLQGKFDEAIVCYRQALNFRPDYSEGHYNLGKALQSKGKLDEAMSYYRQALQIEPDSKTSLNSLAQILAMHPDPAMRNPSEAIVLAERAAKLTNYQDPTVLSTLASAYASDGQFDKAILIEQKALDLAVAKKRVKLAEYIRKKIELYKQKKLQ